MRRELVPEVSVVITNYNYAEYLQQAIESVLSQTYKNISLIIFDDASTDNSSVVLKSYTSKAKIIKHKKNKGIVYTRNEALDIVSTPYILFLDADDWLDRDYIEKLVGHVQKYDLDVGYCGMQYYIDGKQDKNWIPPEFSLDRLKNENYIQMSSLIKTESIGDIRFDINMENLTHEDWDFFLNLGLRGLKFGRVKDASLNYRFKPDGRNLADKSRDEKFASLYKYIYEKFSSVHPEEVGYLAYYKFVEGFLSVSKKLDRSEEAVKEQDATLQSLRAELDAVRNSKAYRVGRIIVLPPQTLKRIFRKVRAVSLRDIFRSSISRSRIYDLLGNTLFEQRNKNAVEESYFIDKVGAFKKTSSYAVVLHLYYTENWHELFADKLRRLSDQLKFDLYVTMPKDNLGFAHEVHKSFKNANILIVPNKGRDVLPFIKTALLLENMGYEKLLKIHSKKSTHREAEGERESGETWLSNTLEALIPKSDKSLSQLIELLEDHRTGVIGPREYYYPLKAYLSHNLVYIKKVMRPIYPEFFSGNVASNLDRLNFFGGTMFWADIKSISGTLRISQDNFQQEKGQTDGTIAHALERMFTVLPQLEGKAIYGASKRNIKELKPEDGKFSEFYRIDVSNGRPGISIVVPVYADWPSLKKNITSLKKYVSNSDDISVYYVNDCGPQADELEKSILSEIEGLTNFYYYRNDYNLGFIKTCNRAALDLIEQTDDVLLLNSDTKVTKNFVLEMRNVLYSDWNIGAVTSRSNNATIWSVPMSSRLANYRWASYILYRLIKYKLPQLYITPTIHGFCVLIRRSVISDHGLFDEAYGKGYGEENDFAMRIRQHGWKCAVANYSYVFHYESRSFGSEERNRYIEANEKILTNRYPEYRGLVQEYWDSIEEPFK